MIETYKHYATGETRELNIIRKGKTQKTGYDEIEKRYRVVILDKEGRWRINKTSFILEESNDTI
jgi:hypothetical protein